MRGQVGDVELADVDSAGLRKKGLGERQRSGKIEMT
jgi:hypothetical protein